MTVIVVDDEKLDRYLVKRTLKEVDPNINLIEKCDGAEFLEFLRTDTFGEECQIPPDVLILLDINMPCCSGFDVLDALREMLSQGQSNANCVVVMMFTSSENETDRARALDYDFVKDFIVKPMDHGQLERILENYQDNGRDAA